MPKKKKPSPALESSLAQYAYDTIRTGILRGVFPLGTILSRRQVAQQLGMSHLPVSEALQRLETDGLVETRPRAGTRVKVPTALEIRGHYIVREALEVQSARLFAEKASLLEKQELKKMGAQLDSLFSDPQADLFEAFRFHERLHRRIAECSGYPQLCDALVRNHLLTFSWLFTAVTRYPDILRSWHQQLIDDLSQGDPDLAERKMREHVRTGMEEVIERMEPYFQSDQAHLKPFSRNRAPLQADKPFQLVKPPVG